MKIRISKSRIAFVAFFCLFLSAGQLKAQEQSAAFSADTSKFLTELNEQFQKVGDADAAEAKLILSTFTYQWTSGGAPLIGETGPLIANLCSGNYNIDVTDLNGCTVNMAADITLSETVNVS